VPPAPSHTHLDENGVLDYVGGIGSASARARVEDHIDGCPECRALVAEAGVAFPPVPEAETHRHALPRAGDLLGGRFRVRRPIGHGAMGVVYEADDELVGVPVALKVLRRADVLDRLRREAQVGRRVSHPRVCRLFDLVSDGEVHFLVMELVTGETLEARLARGPLTPDALSSVLDEIGAALEAAHREGVVHRDLKPQNIMIDGEGRVKVMDFGLARDLDAADSIHLGPVGTPAYWAPEQARGEPATAAADVYSYALVAYRLLAGRPFRLGDPAALTHLPTAYRKPIARALASRPERRWRSGGELRQALALAALPRALRWLRRWLPPRSR